MSLDIATDLFDQLLLLFPNDNNSIKPSAETYGFMLDILSNTKSPDAFQRASDYVQNANSAGTFLSTEIYAKWILTLEFNQSSWKTKKVNSILDLERSRRRSDNDDDDDDERPHAPVRLSAGDRQKLYHAAFQVLPQSKAGKNLARQLFQELQKVEGGGINEGSLELVKPFLTREEIRAVVACAVEHQTTSCSAVWQKL